MFPYYYIEVSNMYTESDLRIDVTFELSVSL